jgi:ammonium transporter Rh
VTVKDLITSDYAAATILISFGALAGKITWAQLFIFATLETVFYTLNAAICKGVLNYVDAGGSVTIHVFGAYFGLAATWFFKPQKSILNANGKCGGSYTSQVITLVGTLFLFMFFPSFNAALAEGMQQERAVVNTYIAMMASVASAMFVCLLVHEKLEMEVMLNATLAGGIAIGASCRFITLPGYSFFIGMIGGVMATLGYLYTNKFF